MLSRWKKASARPCVVTTLVFSRSALEVVRSSATAAMGRAFIDVRLYRDHAERSRHGGAVRGFEGVLISNIIYWCRCLFGGTEK